MNKLYTLLNNMFKHYRVTDLGLVFLGIAIGYYLCIADTPICGG